MIQVRTTVPLLFGVAKRVVVGYFGLRSYELCLHVRCRKTIFAQHTAIGRTDEPPRATVPVIATRSSRPL